MSEALGELVKPVIVGRSSSHFTRVTRIFAAEMGVDCSLEVVRDLMSSNAADYGGNPALKMPALRTSRGVWFGALNICRELSRQSKRAVRTVWPEDLNQPLLANAQELVVHAMATEVGLIMAGAAGAGDGSAHHAKQRTSLMNTMSWLEDNASHALAALPSDRDLSYLEVALFCLVTHLEFRRVLPTEPYPALNGFCREFAARASAGETTYRFDP
ncbi:glutathione S-transferase N-terminal domain-containing protein [Sorangium sp. So ce145]|uniref:glutathione S-transferase N-terminal domain-containing protein n=1 Tax=Sorangium sp. So ce145 TaxID=3133285 RepID=UPI003F5F6E66